jgi:WD40 repeat protein
MRPVTLRGGKKIEVFIATPDGNALPLTEQVRRDETVPHAHRLSPDRRRIAVIDHKRERLHLVAVPFESQSSSIRTLKNRAVSRDSWQNISEVRWLDNKHLVAVDEHHAFILTPGTETVTGGYIEGMGRIMGDGDVMRIVPDGFILKTRPWDHIAETHLPLLTYLHVLNGNVVSKHILNTKGRAVESASVLNGSRIAVAVGKHKKTNEAGGIWIFRAHRGQPTTVIRKLPCTGDCKVRNWAAGGGRFVYALESQDIVIETPENTFKTVKLDHPGDVTALWLNPDGTRIAASNERQMKMWDRLGNLLWATVTTQPITSMHFAGDGRKLLVGVGNQLRVFDATGYQSAMPWKSERYVRINRPAMQFDDAIELPDGGHVFAVIHEDIRTMQAP